MEELTVGSSIPVRFKIYKDGKKANILQKFVEVYGPDENRILYDQSVIEDKGWIIFSLPGNKVDKPGEYNFFFTMVIDGYGDKQVQIKRKVKELPVSKKIASQVTG